jgi:hypothetical protein
MSTTPIHSSRPECHHLDQTIPPRQVFVGKHLGQDPVLGRTEEGRLRRHEKEDREHCLDVPGQEGEQTQAHGDDLETLGQDEDQALVEGVGQVSGVSGEQEIGEGEQGTGDREIDASSSGEDGEIRGEKRDDDLE